MKDVILEFGKNAGIVWNALNSNGPLTLNQLISLTKLDEDNIFSAIGWLAKENKIKKEGEFFKLDETNLSNNIKEKSEKIWNVIDKTNFNFKNLSKLTHLDEKDIYISLGWLAREGKLENIDNSIFDNDNSKSGLNMNNINEEINALNDDIETRNLIIKNISDQLIEKQTQFLENFGSFDDIKTKFEQNKNILVNKTGELSSIKLENLKLKEEITNLNSELTIRNQIIKEISSQLSEKQTKLIENSGEIEQLRDVIDHNKNKMKLMSDKLNDRINLVNDLNSKIEKETNLSELTPEISSTKLLQDNEPIINPENEIDNSNFESDCNNISSIDNNQTENNSNNTQKNKKNILDEN